MRVVVWDTSFRRAFKRLVKRNPELQDRIFDVIDLLVIDPFTPRLRTHALRGALNGLWACWVEYDCRIIFGFDPDPGGGEDRILLVDIGSHQEVY